MSAVCLLTQSEDEPGHGKAGEQDLGHTLQSSIFTEFGRFEEDVADVMNDQDQGANLEEVADPGE